YSFLRIRSSLVPFVNLCSYAGYIAIVIGGIMGAFGLIWLGIGMEVVILLFQLITLPVEFNASKRGLEQIRSEALLNSSEYGSAKTMLTSAALTYVASVATTIIQILRLVLIYGRKR
ncbi:MAG: zinc metallopeptidase, partial [Bacilli bacterium]|nr:zinc metallopeptidase [Bacilli bacterium]